MKRVLQIIRDGEHEQRSLIEPLLDGEQGNMQTLEAMAQIVREDRIDRGIRAFVMREIVRGVRGHDRMGEVRAVFEFARDRIVYRQDPIDAEIVADIWSTMYEIDPAQPVGDCGGKSIFIATCCAVLGHRPAFAVIKQRPNQRAFNHVYVYLEIDGLGSIYLDATPPNSQMGDEPAATVKQIYPI